MAKTTTTPTGRVSWCALGAYLRRHCFFAPLREQVTIPQKTVKYRPIDKVLDGLLGLLCGAKTIAQSNVTIRIDPAVQRAFGRTHWAEQSTIARTLQARTPETVAQLSRVSWYDLQRYGQTPHHRFAERLLWVDVDVTPLPMLRDVWAVPGVIRWRRGWMVSVRFSPLHPLATPLQASFSALFRGRVRVGCVR
jgi:hypothetical protein